MLISLCSPRKVFPNHWTRPQFLTISQGFSFMKNVETSMARGVSRVRVAVGQHPHSFSLSQCGLGKRHERDFVSLNRSASLLLVSNTAQSCVHVHVCRCVQVHRVRVEARGQRQASFQPLSTSFRVTGSLTEPRACWLG